MGTFDPPNSLSLEVILYVNSNSPRLINGVSISFLFQKIPEQYYLFFNGYKNYRFPNSRNV